MFSRSATSRRLRDLVTLPPVPDSLVVVLLFGEQRFTTRSDVTGRPRHAEKLAKFPRWTPRVQVPDFVFEIETELRSTILRPCCVSWVSRSPGSLHRPFARPFRSWVQAASFPFSSLSVCVQLTRCVQREFPLRMSTLPSSCLHVVFSHAAFRLLRLLHPWAKVVWSSIR